MRKLLHLLHAVYANSYSAAVGRVDIVALGKAFINLFYLNRTVQIMFHRDLPEGDRQVPMWAGASRLTRKPARLTAQI